MQVSLFSWFFCFIFIYLLLYNRKFNRFVSIMIGNEIRIQTRLRTVKQFICLLLKYVNTFLNTHREIFLCVYRSNNIGNSRVCHFNPTSQLFITTKNLQKIVYKIYRRNLCQNSDMSGNTRKNKMRFVLYTL